MLWMSWIASNVLFALVLALAAWCMQRLLQRPAIARVLWSLALLKLITPPLASLSLGASSALACTLGTCHCEIHQTSGPITFNTIAWILLAFWSIGAAAAGLLSWCRWARFQRLLVNAVPAPAEWQSRAAELCAELGLKNVPEIVLVPGRLPPLVIPGWRGPRMLLPLAFLNSLNDAQKTAMLLHELVHIKRGDHFARLLELIVGVAYWWLPIAGYFGRQLRACEESCCDEEVVLRRPQARRAYAQLLLDVIDFTHPLPGPSAPAHPLPQATAMSTAQGLEARLVEILAGNQQRRAWAPAALALALALAILPFGIRYDFAGQPAPAAKPFNSNESFSGPTSWEPGNEPNRESRSFKEMCCCPS